MIHSTISACHTKIAMPADAHNAEAYLTGEPQNARGAVALWQYFMLTQCHAPMDWQEMNLWSNAYRLHVEAGQSGTAEIQSSVLHSWSC